MKLFASRKPSQKYFVKNLKSAKILRKIASCCNILYIFDMSSFFKNILLANSFSVFKVNLPYFLFFINSV